MGVKTITRPSSRNQFGLETVPELEQHAARLAKGAQAGGGDREVPTRAAAALRQWIAERRSQTAFCLEPFECGVEGPARHAPAGGLREHFADWIGVRLIAEQRATSNEQRA